MSEIYGKPSENRLKIKDYFNDFNKSNLTTIDSDLDYSNIEKMCGEKPKTIKEFDSDWRKGKYFITGDFDVMVYGVELHGLEYNSFIGTGKNIEDAIEIMETRNNRVNKTLIEKRIIDNVEYYHFA